MSKDIGSGYKQLDATPGKSLGFNLDVDTIKQNLLSQSFAVNYFKFRLNFVSHLTVWANKVLNK